MYTDEELEQLEQEEFDLTTEEFLLLLLLLTELHDNVEKEITRFYQKYGKDGVVTYQEARKWVSNKDHRKRLFVLFFAITDSFDKSFKALEKEFNTHLAKLIGMEKEFFNMDIDDIEKLLNTKWGIENLSWLDRLYNHRSKWNGVINNELKKAMLQRKSINEILEELETKFKGMEKALWNLYTTESSAINSITRKELFSGLGVKKYRFYARVDERMCESCGELHGQVFPMTAYEIGVTASPIHPRCRCWEVPIME